MGSGRAAFRNVDAMTAVQNGALFVKKVVRRDSYGKLVLGSLPSEVVPPKIYSRLSFTNIAGSTPLYRKWKISLHFQVIKI
jgi:hypothetical protein